MTNEQLKSQFENNVDQFLDVASNAMNQLFNKEFEIQKSVIDQSNLHSFASEDTYPKVYISLKSVTNTDTQHILSLSPEFAQNLYAWMIGTETTDSPNDELLEGLNEGTNQVIGQLMAAFDGEEQAFKTENLELVMLEEFNNEKFQFPEEEGFIAEYKLNVGEESYSVNHYAWSINTENDAEQNEEKSEEVADEQFEPDLNSITEEEQPEEIVNVHPAEFDSIQSESVSNGQPRNMNMLLDVELDVVVELGQKSMFIKDLLKLGKGSIVELNKSAGEPLDIFISGRKLAEGEVVVVDDHFGIRITQLVGPKERIKSLG